MQARKDVEMWRQFKYIYRVFVGLRHDISLHNRMQFEIE